MVFNYLDKNKDGQISYEEFRQLDEENWSKIITKDLFSSKMAKF